MKMVISNKRIPKIVKLIFSIYFTQSCIHKCHGTESSSDFVVKMQGLPWTTTLKDITAFFSECTINATSDIHMTMTKGGRPSGVAFVVLQSKKDMDSACKKDQEYLGDRYIEVYPADRKEMEEAIKRSKVNVRHTLNDGCLRLRGLPYKCLEEDIVYFFRGLEIVPNGVTIVTDQNGRPTGDAYVQFSDKDTAEKALQKHGETLFQRYVEVFRSSWGEMRLAQKNQQAIMATLPDYNEAQDNVYERPNRNSLNNPRGLGRGRMNWQKGSSIYMRGLPFKANQSDIFHFFSPVSPIKVQIVRDINGKPTGEANVQFESQDDAVRAMSKDRSYMYHRYVELFLN